jgi:hypothetical protein
MALTGEQTFKGLTISNAYVRVMEVTHTAVDSPSATLCADYSVRIYKDADARTAGDDAITTISGSFTPSISNAVNMNIVKQTYVHLKTLSDFSSLTDV